MFKVALINPPVKNNKNWVREGRCQQLDIWGVPFPPLSLAYICASLQSTGIKSHIFDSVGRSYQNLLREVKEYAPEFIIMTTATPTIESDGNWFAGLLKQKMPEVKIAASGIHVTVLPEETLNKFPCFDYIIIGEPELTVKELVKKIHNREELLEVAGIAFRKDGRIIQTQSRKLISDLDILNFPVWKGIDWKNYLMPIKGRPFSLIEFARGCPYYCKFCNAHAYHGRILRKRSIDKIVEEINWYLTQNIHDFLFWSESFTTDRNYLNQLLKALYQEGLDRKISWVCNSRVDTIDKTLLRKMKKSGCWQIAFGLEFGNENIIKKANKGGNVDMQRRAQAIKWADETGIVADGHFILGYPGENEKTMQDTINFACKLPLTFAHFYCAAPFPGSELFTEALENGWLDEKDIYKISQSNYLMNPPGLSPKIVDCFIKRAYKKFYLRPKTIGKILKIPKGIKQWQNLISLGLKTLTHLTIEASLRH